MQLMVRLRLQNVGFFGGVPVFSARDNGVYTFSPDSNSNTIPSPKSNLQESRKL